MSRTRHTPSPRIRWARALAVLLAAAGLALSLMLAQLHAAAMAGAGPSSCALSEAVDCDRVARSPHAVLVGIPIALWGAFAYAGMLLLAVLMLRGRQRSSPWPLGLLLLLSAAAAAVSVPLAVTSAFVIRSLCLLCAATWVIDWALFTVTLRQARTLGGPVQVIARTARAIGARPGRSTASAALAVAILAGALATYSTALGRRAEPAPAAATRAAPPDAAPGAAPAPLTIFEFSDYECPHCASAHRELRALLGDRSDIRLEHRNFPLDQACNPAVARPFHRSACDLAKAAICAEAQGRFQEMSDALYANQLARRSVDEIAASVGLDLPAFARCRAAPETARRLADEITAGTRAGIAATPTYIVGRAVYQGALPPEVLGRPLESRAR